MIHLRRLVAVAFGGCFVSSAWAVPPEVTGLVFQSKQTLTWNTVAVAEGYHVYRGTRADLVAGDYGDCLVGSVQGTSASDAETPPTGILFTYLSAAMDETGQGSLGTAKSGAARIAGTSCKPARRFFELTQNGDPGDGVKDGETPFRNPSAAEYDTLRETVGVYRHSGELFLTGLVASIPRLETTIVRQRSDTSYGSLGREVTNATAKQPERRLDCERSYRSLVDYNGPLGHNWDTGANARLIPWGIDVLHADGTGRSDRFSRVDTTHFTSPKGIYSVLKEHPDGSFTLRDPNGAMRHFHAFDGTNKAGAIEKLEDTNGRRITFLYDHQGLLTTLVDKLGRTRSYAYDANGRITSVTDFAGRQVVYAYDANGDLVSARSPVVTGTPNGNDFPSGKTTTYTYSSGFADPRLNHNLLSIRSPNEQPGGPAWLQIGYSTTGPAFDLDRVVSMTIGGTNSSGVPAGGTLSFILLSLNPSGNPNDLTLPRRKATVTDRNGNVREYTHNVNGNLLTRVEQTNRNLRPGEPDYTTMYSYDADGELTQVTYPVGNQILLTYDKPGLDRYREGNLLQVRRVADPGRGDGHGGSAADRVWTYTYEPVFNRLAIATDPRGNDPGFIPPNGGTTSPGRFSTSLTYDYQEGDPDNGINTMAFEFGIDLTGAVFNLGDVNGDGSTSQARGNPVKGAAPTVILEPGSNQAAIQGDTTQEIEIKTQYDAFGQETVMLDAEGNRHEHQYYPENDPDGDGNLTPAPPDGRSLSATAGGYLKTRLLDTTAAAGRNNGTNPTPINIREDFAYDDVGNLTDFIDGRGVRTRWVVNPLDQVVEMRRAAATADMPGPDGDLSTGRGETGLTAESLKTRTEYDADDNRVRRQVEDRGATRGLGPYIETDWTHDILGNVLQIEQEATATSTLATQLRYDTNENLTQVTKPEGNRDDSAYDERDLLLSSSRGAAGPRGGTPSTRTYTYDANGSPELLTDGRGGPFDYRYDGFDRLSRVIDQVGSTRDSFYDPAGRVVRFLARGPVGGPTAPDRLGTTNVDLSDIRLLRDELGRVFRRNRALFMPAGSSPARPPILNEGSLLPGDGFVNTNHEYDRLSRRTFAVQDHAAMARFDYDGAGRLLEATHPGGAGSVEWTYDASGNLVETVDLQIPSNTGGPPPEEFLTTFFYDALGRRITRVDNSGQTRRTVYDSLNAATTVTDPKGPPGGSIFRRSPGHGLTSVPVNGHGNVRRHTYDGAGRRLTSVRVLTPSGMGDGTISPAPDTSNAQNPDGLLTLTTVWDDDSLRIAVQDDRGNGPTYAYDNLDRVVTLTADDGTAGFYTYDAEDNVLSRTDPNGSIATYTYDAAGRRTATAVARATGIEGTTTQTFEYDGLMRPTRATDNNVPADLGDDSTVRRYYDSLGRLVEDQQQLGTATRSSDFGWLAEDLLTDLTYPGGRLIKFSYDAAGRLSIVDDPDPGRPEGATFQYFGLGRVHTRLLNNGARTTRLDDAGNADIGYDAVRRTVLLRHRNTSTLFAGFEYRYDRAGNRASVRRTHHSLGAGLFKGERYAFDSANRLTLFEEGTLDAGHLLVSSPTDSQSWTLDGVGNWAGFLRSGTQYLDTSNNNNEYDDPQSGGTRVDDGVPNDFRDPALTPMADGQNLIHDKNGSQTDSGDFTIRYDFRNLPVRVIRDSDGLQVAAYAHDALGRRVKRDLTNLGPDGGITRPLYAAGRLVEERDGTEAVLRQVVYPSQPGGPLWQVRSGTGQYVLEDALGSTSAVLDSGPGGVLERLTYDPYGKPTFENASNLPLLDMGGNFLRKGQHGTTELFRGLQYDHETGTRTNNANTDLGGLYGGVIGRRGTSLGAVYHAVPTVAGPPTEYLRDEAYETVLVAGGRGAGGFYHPLDVTDPQDPAFLWQLSSDTPGEPLFGSQQGAFGMYNPNQGRLMTRDSSGAADAGATAGNGYAPFADNPVSDRTIDRLDYSKSCVEACECYLDLGLAGGAVNFYECLARCRNRENGVPEEGVIRFQITCPGLGESDSPIGG